MSPPLCSSLQPHCSFISHIVLLSVIAKLSTTVHTYQPHCSIISHIALLSSPQSSATLLTLLSYQPLFCYHSICSISFFLCYQPQSPVTCHIALVLATLFSIFQFSVIGHIALVLVTLLSATLLCYQPRCCVISHIAIITVAMFYYQQHCFVISHTALLSATLFRISITLLC